MKKISPKQYACSLYEAIKGKPKNELDDLFNNFLKLVWQNKDWKNLSKIVSSFGKVYSQAEGLTEATVVTAKGIAGSLEKSIKEWLADTTGKTVDLKAEVDQSLLGGLVIKREDTIYDASLKTRLTNLKNSFNK
ncbi:MAG TPA: ATP synthase F1 subunit delta [Patescibacteria group bacterium]|nr:ATP synthase F1 subunit delta [Patescibacteria group bacterium]